MRQNPEEVFVSLPDLSEIDGNAPIYQHRRQLSVGVPVFDQRMEEPFGFVMIECNLHRILEGETRYRVRAAQQVILLDPNLSIWVHDSHALGPIEESLGKRAADVIPDIDEITKVLSRHTEFIDYTNREIYVTRLDLAIGEPGLIIAFLRKPFQG